MMKMRKMPRQFCATMTILSDALMDPFDSMTEHLTGYEGGRKPMFDFGIILVQQRHRTGRAELWIEFGDTVSVGLASGADGFWCIVAPSAEWIAMRRRLLQEYLRDKS